MRAAGGPIDPRPRWHLAWQALARGLTRLPQHLPMRRSSRRSHFARIPVMWHCAVRVRAPTAAPPAVCRFPAAAAELTVLATQTQLCSPNGFFR